MKMEAPGARRKAAHYGPQEGKIGIAGRHLKGGAGGRRAIMRALPARSAHARAFLTAAPGRAGGMNLRTSAALLFALASAAMLGLAAGAVWMVPTLYLGQPLPWLAVPAAWLLGRAIRGRVWPAGRVAALLAALAALLAAVYVSMLTAAAVVAGSLGLGFFEALRQAGPGMLFALARMGCSAGDLAIHAFGVLLAAWVAWRPGRHVAAGK